jgi:hypothetical protein
MVPERVAPKLMVEQRLMNFRSYVYLAIRRTDPTPQDLAGIIWEIGEELGVHTEADLDKLPTQENLSESLQALIESGRVVQVSAHRYREAAYGSVDRTFSGVSLDEYEKACAAYFQRRRWEQTCGWNVDIAKWPGPDRARWRIHNHLISESPDSRHACILYSIAEIRMGWEVGLLALLKGPREQPTVILRPPNFTCYPCVQWLDGGHYCIVVPYLFNGMENRIELLAFTFLDVQNETFTHYETKDILYLIGRRIVETNGHWTMPAAKPDLRPSDVQIDPKGLDWRPWRLLTGTSESPPPDLLGGQLFIETPY